MDVDEQTVESFISDHEEENINSLGPVIICKQNFTLDKIIPFMQEKELLKKTIFCPKCIKIMKMTDSKDTVDKKVFCCRSTLPNHDIRTNIRTGRLYEKIKVSINTILFNFLLFH